LWQSWRIKARRSEMSGKNATASDVDRQHIARPTANWAMSAPPPRPISSDHRVRRPTQQDAYELRSEPAADLCRQANRLILLQRKPATLLDLPRRHSGLRRGRAVGGRAVTATHASTRNISQMSDPEALRLMPRSTSKIRSNDPARIVLLRASKVVCGQNLNV
jgi:hypothetical protein